MMKFVGQQKKDNYHLNMLSELWTKVNTENVRRIARNTLFDFFFGDLEDLELKMKKRVLFL